MLVAAPKIAGDSARPAEPHTRFPSPLAGEGIVRAEPIPVFDHSCLLRGQIPHRNSFPGRIHHRPYFSAESIDDINSRCG